MPSTKLGGSSSSIYNGQTYFRQCTGAPSGTLTFTNQSTTTNSNSNYRIVWGDNSPDYTSATFSVPTTHTYTTGTYTLLFIVSNNTCTDTATCYTFVGSNPAVGLGNPGNTTICTSTSLTFPISGTSNNTPGTTYIVTFSDGSPTVNFSQPPPPDVTHSFNINSCGFTTQTTPSYTNSFLASIQASNPCLTSAATVAPIYVSQKPVAAFTISPKDTTCVNNNLTITNTSASNSYINSTNCTVGGIVWSISPATGWSLNSSTLGNDFGSTDASLWTSGSNALSIKFTVAGTYIIKLKVGNPVCGIDSIVKTICVNEVPTASFIKDKSSGCAPLTVAATGTTSSPNCGSNTYAWTTSYTAANGFTPNSSSVSYIGGTSASSANPQFQFNNPGTYTINLIAISAGGACTSTPSTQQIIVKGKPTVSPIAGSSSVCQNGTISPTVTVGNCNSTSTATYTWTFTGATQASSSSANPDAVTFTGSGTQNITVDVANECGTTTVTKPIAITPAPVVTAPTIKTFCAGVVTGAINFSGTGTSYTWTNSNTSIGLAASGTATSGSPTIPSFTAANSGASPITATITITPLSGCNGTPQSFTITVNPRPAKPTVTRPVRYCLNETATALSATATGNNTLTWYNNNGLNNGQGNAPTPVTTISGTTTYYVNQDNGSCKSDTSAIAVIVAPLIINNVIGSDQSLCSGTPANPLTQVGTLGGGSGVGTYTYQWQSSIDNGITWTDITTATNASYAPGNVSVTTKYRRKVFSNTCADTSIAVTISIQGILGNVSVSAAQTICSGSIPALLDGETPNGGSGTFTYTWERSPDNITWTTIASAIGEDYAPPALTATTYFRRKTTSGTCTAFSQPILITVNPIPIIGNKTDELLCNNTNVSSIAFNSTPTSNVTFAWTNDNINIGLVASGTGNLPAFTTSNNSSPKVPLIGNIQVKPTYTNAGQSCIGNSLNFKITVLPNITVAAISNQTVCSGTPIPSITPTHDAGTFTGSSITFSWTVSGTGTTLIAGNGASIPAFNTSNTGNTDVITNITVTPQYTYNGKTCSGTSTSFIITVRPSTPGASAGADTSLCAVATYTMQAILSSGSTGIWSQFSGAAATITTPSSSTTQITGLLQNNSYKFVWSVTGVVGCPGTTDTVVIINQTPIVNTIDNTPITVCATQPVTINAPVPTGSTGIYTYQWEQSTNNSTWTNIAGQTSQSLTFTPTASIYVRRKVVALPCTEFSTSTYILVQPAISNNTVSPNQNICINTSANSIIGTTPNGGNGNFSYQWQQSIDGGTTWSNIILATSKDYSPGIITATTQYRRIVSTTLCSGTQGNTSTVVTVTVNPDAKAVFTFTRDRDCAPFNINSGTIAPTLFPSQNSVYNWFANGISIGSGTIFPGYLLNNPGDSVTIKLVALSQFGCKNDSMQHKFFSVPKAFPAFTLSDTVGCAPLAISFSNTTPNSSWFTYLWNFGNGLTSTLTQPNNVIFTSNPNYNDTNYIVKLSAITACETVVASKNIRVKSKPKSIFTPNKSTGCSPMTVQFSNLSKGVGVNYIWNFDDGSAIVSVANNAAQTHTFITGIQDTFNVKLIAINDCGNDTSIYKIVVAPNNVRLDFAVNGNQLQGCKPHTVNFINASSGATTFQWNFGDGNFLNTIKNVDTVSHIYVQAGTYTAILIASNGCSDTTSTEIIQVFNAPVANFNAVPLTACIGENIQFTNQTDTSTSLLWNFKDNTTSALTNPSHSYTAAGLYPVQLKAYRRYTSGLTCIDSISKPVTIVNKLPGAFTASATVSDCVPFTVTFTNQSLPSNNTSWDFGNGSSATGNTVTYTFTQVGNYAVKMTAVNPGGCTYETTKIITVRGPVGTWQYDHGNICNTPVQFITTTTGTDSIRYNFGDGTFLTTTANTIYHNYTQAGSYLPTATLYSSTSSTCTILLQGLDTIKIDYIKAGFKYNKQVLCGSTTLLFTDTSRHYLNIVSWKWKFGDGGTSSFQNPQHTFLSTNTYSVQLITTTVSGCSDTATFDIFIKVNDKPSNAIISSVQGCIGQLVSYTASNTSIDSVTFNNWSFSNSYNTNGVTVTNIYGAIGTYTATLISGTAYGCTDTAVHTITINPTPIIAASADQLICKGQSVQLSASSLATINWTPINGTLSCTLCSNPIATPLTTTLYVAIGTNSFGCSVKDSILVTVAQPIKVNVSSNDTICIGSTSTLSVSGATTYLWSPAATLSSSTSSNPIATPTLTTKYQVIGFDNHSCFQDTAFVIVAVGQYPTIALGADQTLATGTRLTLTSTFTNGPITNWLWSPATDLNCTTCPQPIATIKKQICYSVTASNIYKCAARDTICIRVFCENSQLFIPNGFSPDGDGVNDILVIRGSGIKTVKSFRIFNRWGQVVFEKSNISPNDVLQGWDGRIKGVSAPPDVFVYTCEVICDNDVSYTYKGNVAILK